MAETTYACSEGLSLVFPSEGLSLVFPSLVFPCWLDLYGHYAGAFCPEQELELETLKICWKDLGIVSRQR